MSWTSSTGTPGSSVSARSRLASETAETPTTACSAARSAAPRTAPTLPAPMIPTPRRPGLAMLRAFLLGSSGRPVFERWGAPVSTGSTGETGGAGSARRATPAPASVRWSAVCGRPGRGPPGRRTGPGPPSVRLDERGDTGPAVVCSTRSASRNRRASGPWCSAIDWVRWCGTTTSWRHQRPERISRAVSVAAKPLRRQPRGASSRARRGVVTKPPSESAGLAPAGPLRRRRGRSGRH